MVLSDKSWGFDHFDQHFKNIGGISRPTRIETELGMLQDFLVGANLLIFVSISYFHLDFKVDLE